MVESPPREKWPEYHPGNRKDILALGVIALNYGQLENVYRALFSYVTGMNEFQTAAIFHRLPNNHRESALTEVMAKTVIPQKLKDLVQYFASGFAGCAENRHDIMHASSGGRHQSLSTGSSGIVLSSTQRPERSWSATRPFNC